MIDEEKFNSTYDRLLSTFGTENQMKICIEEMSELTKELCKYMRFLRDDKSEENDKKFAKIKENIIEETADVLICASQMKKIFGDEAVEEVMNYKINRCEKRINEYIEKHNLGDKNGKASR